MNQERVVLVIYHSKNTYMAKYSYIKTLSLEEDNNEYRVGVYGSDISKKCDLLINGKPLFDEMSTICIRYISCSGFKERWPQRRLFNKEF